MWRKLKYVGNNAWPLRRPALPSQELLVPRRCGAPVADACKRPRHADGPRCTMRPSPFCYVFLELGMTYVRRSASRLRPHTEVLLLLIVLLFLLLLLLCSTILLSDCSVEAPHKLSMFTSGQATAEHRQNRAGPGDSTLTRAGIHISGEPKVNYS